jgi:hypothetical protein
MTNIQSKIIKLLTKHINKRVSINDDIEKIYPLFLSNYTNNISWLYLALKENINITKESINLININNNITDILFEINIITGIYLIDENKRTEMNIISAFLDLQNEGLELFKKKNTDYGDAFAEYGLIGVLMRIGDKIQRYLAITKNKEILVIDEKIKDTIIDLYNYSTMGLMLIYY